MYEFSSSNMLFMHRFVAGIQDSIFMINFDELCRNFATSDIAACDRSDSLLVFGCSFFGEAILVFSEFPSKNPAEKENYGYLQTYLTSSAEIS